MAANYIAVEALLHFITMFTVTMFTLHVHWLASFTYFVPTQTRTSETFHHHPRTPI